MIEIKPIWNDPTPYETFKYDAAGNPAEITKTFTDLGESVKSYRRNQRSRSIERDVSWFVDTLIHFPASRRAYLNSGVIASMRPLALESLYLPIKKKGYKVPVLQSPYPHCDVNDRYLEPPYLHFLWSMRRSRVYVYYLAQQLGSMPDLKVKDTPEGLIWNPPTRELSLLSWLYWGYRRGTVDMELPFEEVILGFKHKPSYKNHRQVESCRNVYYHVLYLLNLEYPSK
jgi:hypothetical protein